MSKKAKSKLTKSNQPINKASDVKPIEPQTVLSESKTENGLERFVKSRFHWIILFLALVYAGSRYSFYSNFQESILYNQYLGTETDNYFFLDWAKKLPEDWMQDRSIHPYHSWHKEFAKDYFSRHPEEAKKYLREAKESPDSLNAGQLLWNHWYKEKVFHQEPLYPYLLAFFIASDLDPVHSMLILQLILGVAGGVLLMLVTKSNFGYTASFFSGIIYCLCGVLLYNEIVLLRTSWGVFMTILIVYLLDRLIKSNYLRNYLITGAVLGLAYLMQSTFVLFLIVVGFLAYYLNRGKHKTALLNLSVLLLSFMVVISPLLIRNISTGCSLLSSSSVGPVTFIVPNANPSVSYASWYPQANVHTELMEQGHNSLTDAIKVTLKTHNGIGSFIELMYNKLRAIWIGYEYPNNENFYLYREHLDILKYCFFDFFIIAPLALAGLIISIYRRKFSYSLYTAIFFHLAIMLGFYVLARFRAPLVIVAIPFAAYLLSELTSISKRNLKYAGLLMTVTGAFFYLSLNNYSKATEDKFLSGEAYRNVYSISLQKKLDDLSVKEKWNEWLNTQSQIFTIEPDFIRNIESEAARTGAERVSIASFFAEMHQKRKEILLKVGDAQGAQKEEDEVATLNQFIANSIQLLAKYGMNSSDRIKTLKSYANSYYGQKKYSEAIKGYKQILEMDANEQDALNKLGLCYLESGSFDTSVLYFNQLLKINPENSNALIGISGALFFTKKYEEAIGHTKKAVELTPQDGQLYANIAACYMNTGKVDSAVIWLRKGIRTKPTPRTYEYLSNCFVALGKKDSAQIMLKKAKE
jgi:tetratricopeptide (TPR) repeat protein